MNEEPGQQAYREPPTTGGSHSSNPGGWADSPIPAAQPATTPHGEGTVSSELAILEAAIEALQKDVSYLQGLIAPILQENYLNLDEPKTPHAKGEEPLTTLAQEIRGKTSALARVIKQVQHMSDAVRL